MLSMKLDLKSTLECGQIFRFEETAEGYTVFSKDKRALCVQSGETAEMLAEMGSAGVMMAVLVTAAWGGMLAVSSAVEKKALRAPKLAREDA